MLDDAAGETDMAALVKALDPERDEPQVAYQFSNGRKFYSSVTNPYAWAAEDDE